MKAVRLCTSFASGAPARTTLVASEISSERNVFSASTSSDCNIAYLLRTISNETGENKNPTAEPTPGSVGIRIRSTPARRATRVACSGPLPPKAIIVRRHRSLPDSTACIRAALAMPSSTIWLTPSAARFASRPRQRPTPSIRAAEAASLSIRNRPSANLPGSIRPRATSASVTVASVPPFPNAAGPGSLPADFGPTVRRPNLSTSAIDPPPAPISIISITGMRTGIPLPLMNLAAREISNVRDV